VHLLRTIGKDGAVPETWTPLLVGIVIVSLINRREVVTQGSLQHRDHESWVIMCKLLTELLHYHRSELTQLLDLHSEVAERVRTHLAMARAHSVYARTMTTSPGCSGRQGRGPAWPRES